MNDYYSNPQSNPPSNPFPTSPYPSSGGFPSQNPGSSGFPSQNPGQNPGYNNEPPSYQYPQSPPMGTPAPQQANFPSTSSFPSYYTSGQPAQAPQPEAPRSRAKVVLIVAAVLMFACAGVFAGLYVATESDHDTVSSELTEKKGQLADVKKDVTAAEDRKSSAKDTNGDLEDQNAALKPCVEATQHYLWDVNGAPDAERQAALDAMWDACT
jgi:hypothetical protein